jgi:hypothetical protein
MIFPDLPAAGSVSSTDQLVVQPLSGPTQRASVSQIPAAFPAGSLSIGQTASLQSALDLKVPRVNVRLLLDDYCVGNGVTDDYDNFQAAIVAAETLADTGVNVTVVMPRTYHLGKATSKGLVLTRNNTGARGWITFDGGGTGRVKLSNNVYGWFRVVKLADGDTWQKIRIQDVTVDANSSMYGAGGTAVIGFFGDTLLTRVNFQSFEFYRVKAVNVPDPIAHSYGTTYTTGTVSLTNGSTTVIGTGTSWSTANLTAGRVIWFKGNAYDPYVIASIDSTTQITLDRPYAGTSAVTQPYEAPGSYSGGWRTSIGFVLGDTTSAGSRYNVRDIVIRDCDFGGGNDAVWMAGYNTGAGVGVNVLFDNITVSRWSHRQLTPATSAGSEDSVQVGSYGRVGRVVIEDGLSWGTGDGGIEVNQPQDCVIRNCTIYNCWNTGIYLGTYGAYDNAAGARAVVDGCKIIVDTDLGDARGVTLFSNNSVGLGQVTIKDTSYSRVSPNEIPLATQASAAVTGSYPLLADRVTIRDCTFVWSGFNLLSTTGGRRITGIDLRSNVTSGWLDVVVDNVKVAVTGARDSGASSLLCYAILWSGTNMRWTVNRLDWDCTVTGTASTNGHIGIENIGGVSNSLFTLANSTFTQSGDSGPRGIQLRTPYATSQYLRMAAPAGFRVLDCDFSGLGAGSDVNVVTSTANREAMLTRNVRTIAYPSAASVASAANLSLPQIGDLIAVSGATNITSITPTWPDRLVTLRFTGALTVTHGQNLLLDGAANFTTAAESQMQLRCFRKGTYTTGTVAVTNGSAVVTGTSTNWSSTPTLSNGAAAGFLLEIGGVTYLVASWDSSTQLTLAANYTGSTASGLAYTLHQYFYKEISRSA